MPYSLLTIIFALVLFGIAFTLRRQLNQIPKIVQRSFKQPEKLHDEGFQRQVGAGRQEKLQYIPPAKHVGKPYYMTMGLKKLDLENWLIIDSNYIKEHAIRKELLDKSLPSVLQCLPSSELACIEALNLVVDFLVSRYSDIFILEGFSDDLSIRNKATQECYSLMNMSNPLELAARLCMEDFNILLKDPLDQQYYLVASATLFPVGWKLQDRIGGTMAALHKPVPQWQEKLSCPVDRYFDRLSSTSTMERNNTFIQIGQTLFQEHPQPCHETPESIHIPPSDIMLRTERQTFRRLPKSSAILFTVHTHMYPITDLTDEELRDFVEQMNGWPSETAVYKGMSYWGAAVLTYSAARCANNIEV